MKIKKVSILSSFVGLWLTSYLSNFNQIFVGFILILTFGILHGANDLVISKKLNTNNLQKFKIDVFRYLSTILIALLLFYSAPFLTLILFIFISGLHFGEQHWDDLFEESNSVLKNLYFCLYGLLILFLLFYFNSTQVSDVIFSISKVKISTELLFYSLCTVGLLFISISTIFYLKNIDFKKIFFEELFYLLIFTIIFKVSNLIWGFTIYFIIWHSIPSLSDQIKYLYGESTISNFIKYFKDAALYWILALSGLGLFYYYLGDSSYFISIFFSFLAAITFPHVFVIFKMFKTKKTELKN